MFVSFRFDPNKTVLKGMTGVVVQVISLKSHRFCFNNNHSVNQPACPLLLDTTVS